MADLVRGQKLVGFVHDIQEDFLWLNITPTLRGRVPCLHVSLRRWICASSPEMLVINNQYIGLVISSRDQGLDRKLQAGAALRVLCLGRCHRAALAGAVVNKRRCNGVVNCIADS